jgi:hypothetical protein
VVSQSPFTNKAVFEVSDLVDEILWISKTITRTKRSDQQPLSSYPSL